MLEKIEKHIKGKEAVMLKEKIENLEIIVN
jgi:hypothetical protein